MNDELTSVSITYLIVRSTKIKDGVDYFTHFDFYVAESPLAVTEFVSECLKGNFEVNFKGELLRELDNRECLVDPESVALDLIEEFNLEPFALVELWGESSATTMLYTPNERFKFDYTCFYYRSPETDEVFVLTNHGDKYEEQDEEHYGLDD